MSGDFNIDDPLERYLQHPERLQPWYDLYFEGEPRYTKRPTTDDGPDGRQALDYQWIDPGVRSGQPAELVPSQASDHLYYKAFFSF